MSLPFLLLVGLAVFLAACTPSSPATAEGTVEASTPSPTHSVPEVTPTEPLLATTTPTVAASNETPASAVSYSRQVQPIFDTYCISCHGVERIAAGLDLTSYEKVMAGSKNGAMVIPGSASESLLVRLVENGKMPKRGAKPTTEQIQILRDWVNAGAPNN
ncbi:MAG: hypothetical protein N2049_03455 [Anaerolineales bacterium]|nr:hypothetical protein [Anaerolineales bacterium]